MRESVKTAADEPVAPSDPLAELGATLFRPLGADGVYARTALYEDVLERLAACISREREPQAEVLRFPPVMNRQQLVKSGYLKSFPNLLGCVCVLSPAACYPLYPLVASRGRIPPGGLHFDVAADCFRREPSKHLDRLQSFRMREFVRIGPAEEVSAFRDRWMARGQELARDLGLPHKVEPASDPFFGRVGQVMAVSQLQQALKFELLIPFHPAATPTACMSFNCHRDHFGLVWDLRDEAGGLAHTGCVAFGMDRLTVALFSTHGLDVGRWPSSVRRVLAL
jgi:seryl-tRNA synthetase